MKFSDVTMVRIYLTETEQLLFRVAQLTWQQSLGTGLAQTTTKHY